MSSSISNVFSMHTQCSWGTWEFSYFTNLSSKTRRNTSFSNRFLHRNTRRPFKKNILQRLWYSIFNTQTQPYSSRRAERSKHVGDFLHVLEMSCLKKQIWSSFRFYWDDFLVSKELGELKRIMPPTSKEEKSRNKGTLTTKPPFIATQLYTYFWYLYVTSP